MLTCYGFVFGLNNILKHLFTLLLCSSLLRVYIVKAVREYGYMNVSYLQIYCELIHENDA